MYVPCWAPHQSLWLRRHLKLVSSFLRSLQAITDWSQLLSMQIDSNSKATYKSLFMIIVLQYIATQQCIHQTCHIDQNPFAPKSTLPPLITTPTFSKWLYCFWCLSFGERAAASAVAPLGSTTSCRNIAFNLWISMNKVRALYHNRKILPYMVPGSLSQNRNNEGFMAYTDQALQDQFHVWHSWILRSDWQSRTNVTIWVRCQVCLQFPQI